MATNRSPSSGQPRRAAAGPRRDRRQALIDAAIDAISEGSDADISAAAISRRAGVAHGLLFYYFTDKQGLVAAALTDILGKLAAHQGPLPDERTTRARLEGFVRRHLEFLEKYRAAYDAVAREGVLGDPEVARAIDDARDAGARQVARLVGLDEPMTPLLRTAVRGWVGFLDTAADDYFDRGDVDLHQVVTLAVDSLLAVVESAGRIDG